MNSPLKKLDHSVFDGLPPEYKFAAVDASGWAFAYEQRPCVGTADGFSFNGMFRVIPGKFDATDWQNSLIEREEEARDLIEREEEARDDEDFNQEFEFIAQLRAAGARLAERVALSESENTNTEYSVVNHPEHYTANSHGIECIDAIDAATEHLTGIEAVCTANAIKYLWRWKRKNGIQDLHKAKWYINHLIDCLIDNAGDNNE